jgi:leucyl aminopeptidase (aminopeptidase T)
MKYQEKTKQIREEMGERMELVAERLTQMTGETDIPGDYGSYFQTVAAYLLLQWEIAQKADRGEIDRLSAEEGQALNEKLYLPFSKEKYETSFANPAYAVKTLGEDNGKLLAAVFTKIAHLNTDVFEGNIRFLCIYAELAVELYNCFEDAETTPQEISGCVYSFMHDYSELFNEDRVARLLDPDWDYATGILMEADLSDPAYLYRYGRYVGPDELKSAQYLNTFSEEEIQAMADTYTEGYRIGFETTGKDISIKTMVDVRYPLGFERMVRKAVSNFEKLHLRPVLAPYSTSVNKQYDYDHKEDAALWMDKAYVERNLECFRSTFETYKETAPGYGGPAVIEVFGEEPFSPASKPENPRFSEKQQKLAVYQQSEFSQMLNSYIHGEERSFTIIAYPLPSIGAQYEAIFAETVKINTLDYVLYRDMQQKLIDVLDTADRVHIVGTNGNRTDLYVKIYDLADPAKETAFENCVADVNIPVGEVFTSPVLAGTTGKLHVSQVYLNELNYKNLEIDFADGMIAQYTCTNFDDEAENKKYIEDNVLMHHKTLPMGEFAIGTNTTAFRMARVFDIADKMPILIAEKTGPHFAVGDTCYTYDEDNMTYNPDGKAIVARDNAVSALRKTDISKAYFNCHTDITIPYDELGAITVIRKDGSTQDIIRDGRFVVPGTEELNKPLEQLEAEGR